MHLSINACDCLFLTILSIVFLNQPELLISSLSTLFRSKTLISVEPHLDMMGTDSSRPFSNIFIN